jgi:hypothetical protein
MDKLEQVRDYILSHLVDRQFLEPGELAVHKDLVVILDDFVLTEELRSYEAWYSNYWPNIKSQ